MLSTLRHGFRSLALCGLVGCAFAATGARADIDGHGPDAWQVTGVAANDVLNGRMGPGTNYDIITHFAPGERGLIEVTCVPLVPMERFLSMTRAQRDALPARWCLVRSADLARAGWVAARFLQEDAATPSPGPEPAAPAGGSEASGLSAADGTALVAANQGETGGMMTVRLPEAGLVIALPPGWAVDQPWFYETSAGVRADRPTIGFYVNMQGTWQPLLWLNLRQYSGAGCIEIAAGSLCYATAQDRTAAEHIAPLIAFLPDTIPSP